MTNANTGYTTRPVGSLSIADLLEEALQAADTAGFCAAKYPYSLQFSEARDRRNACFAELKRRLAAAEALAEACEETITAIPFSLAIDGEDDEARRALQKALDKSRIAFARW